MDRLKNPAVCIYLLEISADHDSHSSLFLLFTILSEYIITMSHSQISSQTASQFAYEYPDRSVFAHFDFQRPPTLPSSSKSVIRRWAGKWHTSPQDYHYLYDDDTYPLNPTFKTSKPHVKSVFPEYELDELRDTSSTTSAVLRVDGDAFENEDVWSTIAIASIECPASNEKKESEKEEVEIVSDKVGKPTRLTIEKIEKHGSIAKKQKDRKQVSAFPAKAKQFFTSIKNVFRSKSAKSSHPSMIEIPSQKEQSIATDTAEVHGSPDEPENCVTEASAEEETTRSLMNYTSTNAQDKNVSPDATTCKIGRSRSDTWQDDDIIVKRKDEGGIPVKATAKKDIVTKIEGKSGSMTVFETTISFQEDGGMTNCQVDDM